MMRKIRANLEVGLARDRQMLRRHWVMYLVVGLLNLGLVVWALMASAQALTPENAGRLRSLSYGYGSFFGGYMDFTIERRQDGQLYLTATPGNGFTLAVDAPVGEEVLEDLSALLTAQDIFAWDGFHGENMDILDGFSFALQAAFEGGALTAGGYEQYPVNFDQAHAALSGYLWNLAESLLPTQLAGPEEVQGVVLHYYGQDLHLYIYPDHATYYHGMVSDTQGGEALSPALARDFFDQAAAFYNARAGSGRTGCAFGMELMIQAGGVETILQLPGGAAGGEDLCAEPTPLEALALALVGRPADFIGSEAFALETYRNAFVYTDLLVWDPDGLGDVWIDLPGRTVTVNGETWEVPMAAMQRYADAIDSQNLRLPFMSDANRIEQAGENPISSALDWWAGLPRADRGWRFAVAHRNGYTIFAYGGEEPPQGWADLVRAPVQALLDERE